MSSIKTRLTELSTPAMTNRRSFTTKGFVITSSEKTNTCEIEYYNQTGLKVVTQAVLNFTTPGFIGWFPKKGEHVTIEVNESIVYIVGPIYNSYSEYRGTYALKKESLNSEIGGTMSGMIF